ncbi:unnamed protein product [Cuscuta campestris]|uniref:Uncharacterized protein n=1 Tax=Cuscuta campestris TaxID=132261 RepID=A0A484KDT5_9ASTE|nr:unnamed protein product [Cuscuta campestris]
MEVGTTSISSSSSWHRNPDEKFLSSTDDILFDCVPAGSEEASIEAIWTGGTPRVERPNSLSNLIFQRAGVFLIFILSKPGFIFSFHKVIGVNSDPATVSSFLSQKGPILLDVFFWGLFLRLSWMQAFFWKQRLLLQKGMEKLGCTLAVGSRRDWRYARLTLAEGSFSGG